MRRSTRTTHVFSILSDATTPIFSARRPRFGASLPVALPACASTPEPRACANVCPDSVASAALSGASVAIASLLLSSAISNLFLLRRLLLPRAHQGLDAGERLLLAADGLDGVHLAERELEVEAEERLLEPRGLFLQLRLRHVVQALQIVTSLHRLNRAPFLLGPRDELALERQLLRRQAQGLARHLLRHPLDLVEDAAGLDDRDPVVGRALALAHTGLGGLLRDGLVGEHPNPDFAAALDVARHGDTCGLDLPVRNQARLQRLQAVLAEADLGAALGRARHAPLHLLPVLYLLRHQHDEYPLAISCWLLAFSQSLSPICLAKSRRLIADSFFIFYRRRRD